MNPQPHGPATATLSIADVAFDLTAALPLRRDSWSEVYGPFLFTGDAACRDGSPQLMPPGGASPPGEPLPVRVPVTVRRGFMPELAAARHLFDGGRSWSVWSAGEARIFVHAPRGPEQIVWTAQFAPADGVPVRVGCGEELVHTAGAEISLACPLRYPLDQILLMYVLARRQGLLVHAAGVVVDGRLFVLAGRSGAGKSTISVLLANAALGTVLSDDRLVLREQGGRWMGYGTPWPGTARIARAGLAPVAGILFLEHGAGNRPEPLTPTAALHALLPLASILWHERELVGPMTDTAAGLLAAVPAYRFAFSPDVRAVTALAALMRES